MEVNPMHLILSEKDKVDQVSAEGPWKVLAEFGAEGRFEPLMDMVKITVADRAGWSAKLERTMQAQALRDHSKPSNMVTGKTTEVNPMHLIMSEKDKVDQVSTEGPWKVLAE